ncbi:MAG: hypothetical protein NWE92_12285 [Candidatus Bathyarchaeota archaeon]|nr:hypothetical protein [Candidatus Bathyarchaeota archaeon]
MKTAPSIAIIVVAIVLTSLLWYVEISDHLSAAIQSFERAVTAPTPTPYIYSTPQPTSTPTAVPTTPPKPLWGTTTPSTPSFTVAYADYSHDVPPTYKTDPYTGKSIIDQSGYHVDNRTIKVTINNPAFISSVTNDGNTTGLYFNVRSKGHYEDWSSASSYRSVTQFEESDNGQTVILFFLDDWSISSGGEVDFQVQAVVGYSYRYVSGLCGESFGYNFVTVGESGWSGTQTVSVP